MYKLFFFFDKTSQIEKEPEQTDNDIGGHAVRALTFESLNFNVFEIAIWL